MKFKSRKFVIAVLLALPVAPASRAWQTLQRSAAAAPIQTATTTTHADILRGEYGRYRANNDLLSYHLDIRVDPEKKFISGKNTIRFKMLKDDTRIQLDLYATLKVDKILFTDRRSQSECDPRTMRAIPTELKYTRDSGAVFVDFPETLQGGQRLHDRFLLLRHPEDDGPLRRLHLPEGPGRPAVDQHRLRRRGRQHLVAEQGPVARRGREDGHQRRDPERSGRRLERQVHGQDRPRRRLHALGLARALPDQQLRRLAEHRQLRALRPTSSATCRSISTRCPEDLEKAKKQFAQAKRDARGLPALLRRVSLQEGRLQADRGALLRHGAPERRHLRQPLRQRLPASATGPASASARSSTSSSSTRAATSGSATASRAADVSDMWIHEGWTTYLECLYVEYMLRATTTA